MLITAPQAFSRDLGFSTRDGGYALLVLLQLIALDFQIENSSMVLSTAVQEVVESDRTCPALRSYSYYWSCPYLPATTAVSAEAFLAISDLKPQRLK